MDNGRVKKSVHLLPEWGGHVLWLCSRENWHALPGLALTARVGARSLAPISSKRLVQDVHLFFSLPVSAFALRHKLRSWQCRVLATLCASSGRAKCPAILLFYERKVVTSREGEGQGRGGGRIVRFNARVAKLVRFSPERVHILSGPSVDAEHARVESFANNARWDSCFSYCANPHTIPFSFSLIFFFLFFSLSTSGQMVTSELRFQSAQLSLDSTRVEERLAQQCVSSLKGRSRCYVGWSR